MTRVRRPARPIVVVKVGSSSVTTAAGDISEPALATLTSQLAAAAHTGARPILVSSGAIATGRGAMPPGTTAGAMDELQALAAIGQGLLMARYTQLLSGHGLAAGQVLFTAHDFGDRTAYLNSRRTVQRLLAWNVIPIVNENDTTATDEISFGDNDRLAALVAALVGADLLLILTDTEGIYSADPRLHAEASLIEEVAEIDAAIEAIAGGSSSGVGSGGMATKVAAARLAAWSGLPCVIARADLPDVVARAVAGDPVGTRIFPRQPRLPARKGWIAFARTPRGRLTVDSGAVRALCSAGGSLLPVGVASVTGHFDAGDAVEIIGPDDRLIAKGLVSTSSTALAAMVGNTKTHPALPVEVVHRDNLVVLTDGGGTAP